MSNQVGFACGYCRPDKMNGLDYNNKHTRRNPRSRWRKPHKNLHSNCFITKPQGPSIVINKTVWFPGNPLNPLSPKTEGSLFCLPKTLSTNFKHIPHTPSPTIPHHHHSHTSSSVPNSPRSLVPTCFELSDHVLNFTV